MAGGKGSKQIVNLTERRYRALELRKAGASYRAIATAISQELNLPKYDQSVAYDDVQYVLKELREKTSLDAKEYVRLELERLDTMQLALSNKVKKGDVNAVQASLRIMERRSKYLGLDLKTEAPPEDPTTGISWERITDADVEAMCGDRES